MKPQVSNWHTSRQASFSVDRVEHVPWIAASE
jgi:hypothetical protein